MSGQVKAMEELKRSNEDAAKALLPRAMLDKKRVFL